MIDLKATAVFKTRIAAYEFAESWTRFSLKGHSIGSGTENVKVTLYGVDSYGLDFISWYVKKEKEKQKFLDQINLDQIL